MIHNDDLALERLEAAGIEHQELTMLCLRKALTAQGSEQTFQVVVALIHAGLYQSESYTALMDRMIEQEREERLLRGVSFADEAGKGKS